MNPGNLSAKRVVWTIAGSDSGGGAGIQADLHTFQALGVHGCSVITAVTAQNTCAVQNIHFVPVETIMAQLTALKEDLPPQAIKLGMLGDKSAVAAIINFLQDYSGKAVLDPVMIAGSGDHLFADELSERILLLQQLFPLVDVVTPNLHEAASITGCILSSHQAIEQAAKLILAMGVKSVLIKGGHFTADDLSQDFWTNGVEAFWLSSKRLPSEGYHGAGCTLSSAIAATLAKGCDIKEALVMGKMYVNRGLRLAQKQGAGLAPVAHGDWHEESADLPYVSVQPIQQPIPNFPDCGEEALGLYPLVEKSAWLEILLPLGIKTVQLRIKNLTGAELEDEIKRAVFISKQFNVRLFINDYWDLAIKYGAYGVHLGQTDLNDTAIKQLSQSGLRLGVSTHNYYELAVARALHPSYIALGPIFSTNSKQFSFAPLGIKKLQQWRKLVQSPLVAIGGIGKEQVLEVLTAGADGVALIAAITKAEDPVSATQELLSLLT
jgi:hydroxymethylpyrimidine kinase / phosphomethylpyrimidine kinase / thiamine-phosphate diphosphorylase